MENQFCSQGNHKGVPSSHPVGDHRTFPTNQPCVLLTMSNFTNEMLRNMSFICRTKYSTLHSNVHVKIFQILRSEGHLRFFFFLMRNAMVKRENIIMYFLCGWTCPYQQDWNVKLAVWGVWVGVRNSRIRGVGGESGKMWTLDILDLFWSPEEDDILTLRREGIKQED